MPVVGVSTHVANTDVLGVADWSDLAVQDFTGMACKLEPAMW